MKFFKKYGFVQSSADLNVFYFDSDGFFVILVFYVDDAILLSNYSEQFDKVKVFFRSEFEMTDQGFFEFCFGIQILRDRV